jgi:hypothetical protein
MAAARAPMGDRGKGWALGEEMGPSLRPVPSLARRWPLARTAIGCLSAYDPWLVVQLGGGGPFGALHARTRRGAGGGGGGLRVSRLTTRVRRRKNATHGVGNWPRGALELTETPSRDQGVPPRGDAALTPTCADARTLPSRVIFSRFSAPCSLPQKKDAPAAANPNGGASGQHTAAAEGAAMISCHRVPRSQAREERGGTGVWRRGVGLREAHWCLETWGMGREKGLNVGEGSGTGGTLLPCERCGTLLPCERWVRRSRPIRLGQFFAVGARARAGGARARFRPLLAPQKTSLPPSLSLAHALSNPTRAAHCNSSPRRPQCAPLPSKNQTLCAHTHQSARARGRALVLLSLAATDPAAPLDEPSLVAGRRRCPSADHPPARESSSAPVDRHPEPHHERPPARWRRRRSRRRHRRRRWRDDKNNGSAKRHRRRSLNNDGNYPLLLPTTSPTPPSAPRAPIPPLPPLRRRDRGRAPARPLRRRRGRGRRLAALH